MQKRHVELDALRTVAILMMVMYHLAYDLQTIYGWDIDVFSSGWILFARATASLFLLLVGCSFAISWNRHQERHHDHSFLSRYRKYLRRGLIVLGCGVLVSTVTYVYDPETYVRFGILHLIGVSILLLPFFAKAREGNALIGLVVLGMTYALEPMGDSLAGTGLLVSLGIPPPEFASVDYFPLIPWFGVVLIGYAVGYAIYVRQNTRSLTTDHSLLTTLLAWPGRHALLIYLLHQPLLLGILGIAGFFGIL